MPAVAYSDDYDFGDDIGDYDYDGNRSDISISYQVHQASHVDILASAAGGANGGGGNSSGGGSITGGSSGGSAGFVGSGAGGGGGHRCPKCGANVTFQDTTNANDATQNGHNGSIQNNCFYCAACSGWFLIQPNSEDEASTSAHSKYLLSKLAGEESGEKQNGLPTTPSNRKISQPQFVMQHVSYS